jgi:glycosyltransferase involved in cell wall biosynthesis
MDENTLFFSIIIPTYNRAGFIERTISSILSNSYKNFEIIIVDDGSTDNTKAVVRPLINSKVHYYKKENGERGAARNYGLKKAKGEYVNFFDSDDLCHTNHLFEAEHFIRSKKSPKVFHLGYNIISPNGRVTYTSLLPEIVNNRLIDGNHLGTNGVFVKRDIALNNQFNEDVRLAVSEDYELWLRLASKYNFYNLNVVTSSLFDHAGRSVVAINKEKLATRIQVLKDSLYANQIFLKSYGSRIRTFECHLEMYLALHFAMNKETKFAALSRIRKAIVLDFKIVLNRKLLGTLKTLFFKWG